MAAVNPCKGGSGLANVLNYPLFRVGPVDAPRSHALRGNARPSALRVAGNRVSISSRLEHAAQASAVEATPPRASICLRCVLKTPANSPEFAVSPPPISLEVWTTTILPSISSPTSTAQNWLTCRSTRPAWPEPPTPSAATTNNRRASSAATTLGCLGSSAASPQCACEGRPPHRKPSTTPHAPAFLASASAELAGQTTAEARAGVATAKSSRRTLALAEQTTGHRGKSFRQ